MRLSELDYRARRLQATIAMEQAAPVDPLSRSLWDFGTELAALDDLGMIAEAEAMEVPVEALQSMRESYTRTLCW